MSSSSKIATVDFKFAARLPANLLSLYKTAENMSMSYQALENFRDHAA
jgi:hypothetical protein